MLVLALEISISVRLPPPRKRGILRGTSDYAKDLARKIVVLNLDPKALIRRKLELL